MKLALALLVLSAARSLAHEALPRDASLFASWTFEPGVVSALAATGALYSLGIAEYKDAGIYGRAFKKQSAWSFWIGFACLVIALTSPIHALGSELFAVHMTQHEILMLAAAPLIVLGRPVLVILKAVPGSLRVRLLSAFQSRPFALLSRFLTNAGVAWFIHGAVLWLWHAPPLFSATARSGLMHALQHVSFFGSALLFWWAVLDGHQKRLGYGIGVLYLFTTALHSGILGALLTFSRSIWYRNYASAPLAWGLTPLEDQQLGGLIMWVPASIAYIVAALALFCGWLRESERRAAATTELLQKGCTA
jgi:cytochrome c oxidase assembly factor CtaG